MSSSHRLLKTSRLIHLYLGVFITPALIFFAFTGFVQTFSLHETTRGSDYKPPAILVKLGQMHKKQTLVVPVRKQPPPAAATAPAEPQHAEVAGQHHHDNAVKPSDAAAAPAPATKLAEPPPPAAKPKNLLPMKLFFALVSVGLLISTLTGLYMSYKFIRNKPLITATFVAGIVIPILLTFL